MKARKIVLASGCLVLLIIAIIQAVTGRIDPVKILSVKEEIDEIVIERPEGNLNLKKSGEDWFINDKYVANYNEIEGIADSFSEVKILGKVTKTDNEEVLSKYDLNKDKAYKVTVLHDGKKLASYSVGKSTSTDSQVYIMIGDSNEVSMAQGNLKDDCSKTINELRSKAVLQLQKDDMTSVTVKPVDGKAWTVTRSGEGNIWNISGEGTGGLELDSEITSNWFQGCATLAATDWLGDNEEIPAEKIIDVEIMTGKKVTLSLYQGRDEEGTELYWGSSSETPYNFKLAKYSVQKYHKNPEDFTKSILKRKFEKGCRDAVLFL